MQQFFLPGSPGSFLRDDAVLITDQRFRFYLLSLAYLSWPKGWAQVEKMLAAGEVNLMLDSGAFTAWTKGKELSLSHLVDVYRQVIDQVTHVVALDRLPGRCGELPNAQGFVDAGEFSYQNYMRMLEAGLPLSKLVPTFHHGEPLEFLDRLIETGAPLVALSSRKDLDQDSRVAWFHRCSEIAMVDGKARAHFHAFGLSIGPILEVFPWFSCDCTSYIRLGVFGRIMFENAKGQLRYPYISNEGAALQRFGSHLDCLSKRDQKYVREYIEARGFELEDIRKSAAIRTHFNALVCQEFVLKSSFNGVVAPAFF